VAVKAAARAPASAAASETASVVPAVVVATAVAVVEVGPANARNGVAVGGLRGVGVGPVLFARGSSSPVEQHVHQVESHLVWCRKHLCHGQPPQLE
jgi:hypothetical protein